MYIVQSEKSGLLKRCRPYCWWVWGRREPGRAGGGVGILDLVVDIVAVVD